MPDTKASADALVTTPDATTSVLALHGGTPANGRLNAAGIDKLVNLVGVTHSTKTANYTLAIGDMNTVVEMNVASANTLTVPPNSSVAFPVGTVVEVAQYGAGQTTVVAGSGVTIRTPGTLVLRAQYSSVTLRKRATDEWWLSGDTT
jgi:hypothetical protein